MSEFDGYVLPRSTEETDRLRLQARIFGPYTEHLLTLAGIGPGMRVLDVGCGPGDVTMLAARLVGPTGSVIGVDIDKDVLVVAKNRAAEAGLANVSFQQGTLPDIQLAEPVDALIGRLIVMHLDDPVDAVRKLSRLVRSGGIVSFQDYNSERCRSVPELPLFSRSVDWIVCILRANGLATNPGERLSATLRAAGLRVIGAAVEIPGGDAESGICDLVAESVNNFMAGIEAYGIATREEVDPTTLAERLKREASAANAVTFGPELAAAWALVP